MERACPSSSTSWRCRHRGWSVYQCAHPIHSWPQGLTTDTYDLHTLLVQGQLTRAPEVSRVRTHTHARTRLQCHDGKKKRKKKKKTVTQSFTRANEWGASKPCLKVTQKPASPSLFMCALLIGRGPPAAAPLRPTLRLSGHPYRSQAIKWQAARQGYRGCGNSRGGKTQMWRFFNENYNNITLLVFSAGVKYECKQTGKRCTFTAELEYCA